ncbi:uncharacterized protein LOC130410638 [Triplophysa dalaica]|uniref:uncharacterized protein LOC130410638 n=1 Tax=Triplophysa dalaica TaxID=1582913 RepID=UPI0024DFF2A4|nr:uncharacterized protein LOC130410638 [Triplophysa dalaica]
MERSRVTVTALMYVSLFCQIRICGAEIEMKVRPGDNITIICDRPITHGSFVWIRNCSHEHQPSLIIDFTNLYVTYERFPHFSILQNSNNSFDLHITNITVSDLGLYYCAEFESKLNKDEKGCTYMSDVYYYGNRRTRVSLAVTSGPYTTVSPPPVSNCFSCCTVLFSVCPVCVLFCSICVYCLCQKKTAGCEKSAEALTGRVMKVYPTEKHQCETSESGKFCFHSEVKYSLLSSSHPYAKM